MAPTFFHSTCPSERAIIFGAQTAPEQVIGLSSKRVTCGQLSAPLQGISRLAIVVVGTGYVGLVTGACFAEMGHTVTCVDRDAGKIAMLNAGEIPIYEPGLADLVARHAGKRLEFTTELARHLPEAEIAFIAVGTPASASGEANLSAVFAAAEEIAHHLSGHTVLALKSTVPVGTASRVASIIAAIDPNADVSVASNPEFLREGAAVEDFLMPDRVVVGLRDKRTQAVFERLYAPLAAKGVPVVYISNEAAELTKYAANTYLAVRIAYVNELADICEAVGADIGEVTVSMGLDSRIGLHYLSPGPGFGGSCFPKDTRALLATTRAAGVEFTLGEAVIAANDRRKGRLHARVVRALGGSVAGRRIGILGLAFKANTDDVRDSAALPLIRALQAGGAIIQAHDPEAMDAAAQSVANVIWCEDSYAAAASADAIVVMTEWDEFRDLELRRLASLMRSPVMIDFRNLFALADAAAAGLSYISVGRATAERLAIASRDSRVMARSRKPLRVGPGLNA